MTKNQIQNLQKARNSILWYADHISQIELEDYQRDVLVSVQNNLKTAWKAGHGVGKSTVAAITANWFYDVFPYSKVITTASAWRQVQKMLWPEIHKWRRTARLDLIGIDNTNEIRLKLMLQKDEDWFVTGEASDDSSKMEGFHADNLLYIIDEGKSVPDATYEAIEGALTTGNVKVLVISTPPPEKAGYFYEIFSRKRVGYTLFHTNAEDSKRVSRQWIEDRKKEWGENSPIYQTRVKGEFAESSEDLLINLKWLEEAVGRIVPEGQKALGVDFARYGSDSTAIAERNGQRLEKLQAYNQQDLMQTTGMVKNTIETDHTEINNLDVIGMGGGPVDRLLEQGVAVNGINVGDKSSFPEKFANLRAEIYWNLREIFRAGEISIPDDEELIGQASNIKFHYNSRGQLVIESKDEMKKRGLKSPDKLDAVALAYYVPPPQYVEAGVMVI